MKKLKIVIAFLLVVITAFPQTPDFSLIGFGAAATGGGNGAVVNVNNLTDLIAALLRTEALTINITGTIEGENGGNLLEVKSNKTIMGIGNTAFLSMIQLYLKNAQNVIIRNIRFSMIGSTLESDADCISIATTSSGECKDIWIDHCEFYNVTPVLPENAANKDKYDGLIDIKKASHNITISWNYFHDHWKCSLIGFTDTNDYDRKITYHHNYFKNIKSRVPSYRHGTGHIFNNYYEGLPIYPAIYPSTDGINTRMDACLKVSTPPTTSYTNRFLLINCGSRSLSPEVLVSLMFWMT
jgi:pectate lyase